MIRKRFNHLPICNLIYWISSLKHDKAFNWQKLFKHVSWISMKSSTVCTLNLLYGTYFPLTISKASVFGSVDIYLGRTSLHFSFIVLNKKITRTTGHKCVRNSLIHVDLCIKKWCPEPFDACGPLYNECFHLWLELCFKVTCNSSLN